MDFLRAGLGIIVIVGLALILGRTRDVKHPATHMYLNLSAIAILLLLRWCL